MFRDQIDLYVRVALKIEKCMIEYVEDFTSEINRAAIMTSKLTSVLSLSYANQQTRL
jgi:hypothetical protein